MDLKLIIARIASDCDLRTRFLRAVPTILDKYYLSRQGELLTEEEANKAHAFTYFLDGMDFISGEVIKA